MANYYLMHKDYKVALLTMDKNGTIDKVKAVLMPERLPIGVKRSVKLEDELNSWMRKRGYAAYSDAYKRIYHKLGVRSGGELLLKSNAVCLTDCYWFRPEPNTEDLTWDKVNFFNNGMSNDLSLLLVYPSYYLNDIDYRSPNLTTQGTAKKFWLADKESSRMMMFKFGDKNNSLPVYNEIICGMLNDKLGLNHIQYDLVNLSIDGNIIPCSVCDSMFEDDSVELVTMQEYINDGYTEADIIQLIFDNNLEESFYRMLVSDYLVMNIDRSFYNFGIVRDSETLEILELAPLYDNTNCLYYDWQKRPIGSYDEAKPFYPTQEKQIKMVQDFSWYDDTRLWSLGSDVDRLFAGSNVPKHVQDLIKQEIWKRMGMLRNIIAQNSEGIIQSLDEKLQEAKDETDAENDLYITLMGEDDGQSVNTVSVFV